MGHSKKYNIPYLLSKWGFQNLSLHHSQNYSMYGLQLLFIIMNWTRMLQIMFDDCIGPTASQRAFVSEATTNNNWVKFVVLSIQLSKNYCLKSTFDRLHNNGTFKTSHHRHVHELMKTSLKIKISICVRVVFTRIHSCVGEYLHIPK